MTLYKIQPLLESGFNFSVVFPEKQKSLQEHSGFNFGLQEIALLIKKQTGNFANKNDIALDIDKYLFEAYQKHIDATEPKEEKKEEPKKELSVDEQIKTSKGLIRLYEMKLRKAIGDEKVRIEKLVKFQNRKIERLSKVKEHGGTILEKGGGFGASGIVEVKPRHAHKDDIAELVLWLYENGWSFERHRTNESRKNNELPYIQIQIPDGSKHRISNDDIAKLSKLQAYLDNKQWEFSNLYEQGGNVIEVTSSVQDPKPTGADELSFTHSAKDPTQMAKGGGVEGKKEYDVDGRVGWERDNPETQGDYRTIRENVFAYSEDDAVERVKTKVERQIFDIGGINIRWDWLDAGVVEEMAKGGGIDNPKEIKKRLEYLRGELRAEKISYGELAELQSLSKHIDANDVELLEAAGVEEKHAKGGALAVGDNVHINDKKSSLNGKAGLIMGVHGKYYLLKVVKDGEEIDITVPKKHTTPFPENID